MLYRGQCLVCSPFGAQLALCLCLHLGVQLLYVEVDGFEQSRDIIARSGELYLMRAQQFLQ